MQDSNTPPSSPSGAPPIGAEQIVKAAPHSNFWEVYLPKKLDGHRDEIFVASFPPIIYFWPTVITLFLCAFLQGVGVSPVGLGWFTVAMLSLNLLVLVQDFDQKKFIILILSLVAAFLVIWIINLYGFTFLKRIANSILSLEPQVSTDGYLLSGTIMLLLFGWGLLTPIFSYWKLEQNEFVHYTRPVGKDMSIARAGCSVYKEIPDVFEYILGFGAGTLIIRKDNQILASIPDVPFLTRRMEAIEHMLSETRVIVDRER